MFVHIFIKLFSCFEKFYITHVSNKKNVIHCAAIAQQQQQQMIMTTAIIIIDDVTQTTRWYTTQQQQQKSHNDPNRKHCKWFFSVPHHIILLSLRSMSIHARLFQTIRHIKKSRSQEVYTHYCHQCDDLQIFGFIKYLLNEIQIFTHRNLLLFAIILREASSVKKTHPPERNGTSSSTTTCYRI